MEAILADGITKSYRGSQILRGACLAVESQERIFVCGPTGCGKTTLLMILAGLVRADAGRVSLFGDKVSGNGVFVEPDARALGVVFQKPVLWPHMTAAENVEFALYSAGLPRRERKNRAVEALELFGAAELAGCRPHTLSGGQAQRVALARSIASQPRILLWDEPFTGLDASSRDQVGQSARDYLAETGGTLVGVSHHAEDAAALEAEIVFLKEGRLERIS